ncbi:MAG: sensor domain-containing diguanylate cyclase [Ferrovum sp.]|nr:sensor domain-containing diguanylate cyclase [Ferrovum sp.]
MTNNPIGHHIYWGYSQAFMRYAISLTLAGCITYLITLSVFAPEEMWTARGIRIVLLLLLTAAARFLLSLGKIEAAAPLLAFGVWGVVTVTSIFLGGLHAHITIVVPLIIIMVGWLLGTHLAALFTLLTVITSFGFLQAELWSLLPEFHSPHPVLIWIDQSFAFVLSAMIITHLVKSYHDRLQEVHKLTSDLTQRTAALEANKADLDRAQAIAHLGSWVYDLSNDVTHLSAETCRIFGLPEGTKGSHDTYLARSHPEDRVALDRAWQAALRGAAFDVEHRIIVNEAVRWVRQRAELEYDKDGKPLRGLGTTQDITERKTAEDKINSLAFYDPLTHLPNRRLLMDRLQQAMAFGARSGRTGAVLFIDLDNFKTLNDTLGHGLGDLQLQQTAERLSSCVREGDTVARLGGDEFVVMLKDLSENNLEAAAQTESIGKKILVLLSGTYHLATHEYRSTASIGATLFNGHGQAIEELLKQADIAMYQAKKSGRNALCFFDRQMQVNPGNHERLDDLPG